MNLPRDGFIPLFIKDILAEAIAEEACAADACCPDA
jgi:hypothetical protein